MITAMLLAVGAVTVVHLADARGPHHPRGEPVVKHVHHKATKEGGFLTDSELLHDKEHMEEHLENIIDEIPDMSKMSDEELEFYYFQLHDTDKNDKLDGLEILQAILHTTHQEQEEDEDEDEDEEKPNKEKEDFEYYIELIDKVLQDDDKDEDGFLNYVEFASGRKKAILAERKSKQVPQVQEQPSVQMVN